MISIAKINESVEDEEFRLFTVGRKDQKLRETISKELPDTIETVTKLLESIPTVFEERDALKEQNRILRETLDNVMTKAEYEIGDYVSMAGGDFGYKKKKGCVIDVNHKAGTVFVLGEDGNPEQIRVELCSENDMFFHYSHNLDENSFKQV